MGFANRIGEVLKIEYRQEHLDMRVGQAAAFVQKSERWKGGVTKPIRQRESKFASLFSESEQKYIERRLNMRDYDMSVHAALV